MIIMLIIIGLVALSLGLMPVFGLRKGYKTIRHYDPTGKSEWKADAWDIDDLPDELREHAWDRFPVTFENKPYWDWDWNIASVPLLIAAVIAGLGGLPAGINCALSHSPMSVQLEAADLNSEYDKLSYREQTIHKALEGDMGITVEESPTVYHVIVDNPIDVKLAIDEYNCGVVDFKTNVYKMKVKHDNPWISWFCSPAFEQVEGYNPDATSYKDVLGEHLKTFEVSSL